MSARPARADRLQALAMLSPAYLWLTAAVFLPLSAMVFFSFLSDVPFGGRDWHLTLANYAAFFETPTYALLLWKSVRLALIVTALCVLIGFPCAWVLAKMIRGRSREALFLLVILPFWSNSLVRVCSPGPSCCAATGRWTGWPARWCPARCGLTLPTARRRWSSALSIPTCPMSS